jgi:diguanylate cyclase (GGDEF)-like protein
LFIDLDDFKPINDTFGHAAGDMLLTMVAESLCRILPATDVIARMGGDEFTVLANDVTAEQALAIGHQIIDAVTMPYTLDQDIRVSVGVSVGIAMSPDHGAETEELLTIADAALYQAKSSGNLLPHRRRRDKPCRPAQAHEQGRFASRQGQRRLTPRHRAITEAIPPMPRGCAPRSGCPCGSS